MVRGITLELKQNKNNYFRNSTEPYLLCGVEEITDKTEYGLGYFAITIFDKRLFLTEAFEYVKNHETGEFYVKDGKWAKE